MVVTAPRCGARRHHSAAAGFSVGNGPCPAASVSSAGDGEAGGVGEGEPPGEDRPVVVLLDVGDADPGEGGGPPVGAVGGVTRRLHAPLGQRRCAG